MTSFKRACNQIVDELIKTGIPYYVGKVHPEKIIVKEGTEKRTVYQARFNLKVRERNIPDEKDLEAYLRAQKFEGEFEFSEHESVADVETIIIREIGKLREDGLIVKKALFKDLRLLSQYIASYKKEE